MTFDPTQNRVPTCLLTTDELAAFKAAKHGLIFWNYDKQAWVDKISADFYLAPGSIYRAKPAPRPTIICNGVEVQKVLRYQLGCGRYDNGGHWAGLKPDEDGEYVRYADHIAALSDAVSHAKAMAKAGCV